MERPLNLDRYKILKRNMEIAREAEKQMMRQRMANRLKEPIPLALDSTKASRQPQLES